VKLLKIFSELSIVRLAVVAVMVTAGYYFMYYDNGEKVEEQIKQAETDLATEKAKRADIEKKMKKEEEMRGNVMQLAANLELVKTKIPNEFNEIEIAGVVNRVSAAAQVKILGLKRGAPLAKSTVTGAELIDEVNFDIQMSGSFIAIVTFVEQLARETKIIKIRNFSMTGPSFEKTEDNTIQFTGEIVGYKQSNIKTQAPDAAAAPAPAPAPAAPPAGGP
jgi:Tfp pilus assembly protein PilO